MKKTVHRLLIAGMAGRDRYAHGNDVETQDHGSMKHPVSNRLSAHKILWNEHHQKKLGIQEQQISCHDLQALPDLLNCRNIFKDLDKRYNYKGLNSQKEIRGPKRNLFYYLFSK